MYAKYDEPDGVTRKMVVWSDAGPWKTTTVYKDPVAHNFPKPHKDVLEQTVNYEVPTDKIDELSAFDGSVFAKRSSGVLGTTCDNEPMNLLTLNLAHDIIVGKKDVAEARESFAEIEKAYCREKSFLTRRNFSSIPPREVLGPSEAVINPEGSQGQELLSGPCW